MGSIDIKCEKNIVFSHKSREGVAQCNIKVGTEKSLKYWSYLYFDVSGIPSSKELIEASLVLFKVPTKINIEDDDKNNKLIYSIMPTIDYVSKYSYFYNNTIKVENRLLIDFVVEKDLGYVEIDITEIVKKWTRNELENKGLLLMGRNKSCYMEMGGCQYNSIGYPFLKVKYKEFEIEDGPVIDLPVEVIIKEE